MKSYLHDKRLVLSALYLFALGLVGLFADHIASDGGVIPFGPDSISSSIEVYSGPGTVEKNEQGFDKTHYLGTDQIGRDVASRLIHGITIAYKVGILSSLLSLFIAVILGGLSGYFGDRHHRINLYQIAWVIIGLILAHHFATELAYHQDERGVYNFYFIRYFPIIFFFTLVVLSGTKRLGRIRSRQLWLPWDTIIVKLIEVFKSIPKLFFLLAIFAVISSPSVISVVVVIGIMRWPALTRLIRAEIMTIKQDDFVNSARILGLPAWRILLSHIAPNIYKPVIVLTALNIGTAILLEASLSFLQIGLPIGEISWGQMLGDARSYIPAWWMAVGPGLLIFSLILAFNVLGNRLSYHFRVSESSTEE